MTAESKSGRPGRQAFAPTDDQRAEVRRLVTDGRLKKDIATAIGVSLPTLRKAFAADLAPPSSDLFAGALPTDAHPPRLGTGGRPAYVPNDWDRNRLLGMLAGGATIRAAADVLGIAEPTIRKHYADDIERAAEIMHARNLDLLAKAARSGNVAAIKAYDEKMAKAAMIDLAARVKGDPSERDEKKGKKEQAADAAAGVLSSPGWGNLIGKTRTVQ